MKKITFVLLVVCLSMISYSGFAADAMLDKLSANETSLWDAIKKQDMKTFAAGLSDDILDIDISGVIYNKQQLVDALSKMTLSDFTLSDFKWFALDKDAGVLTYSSSSTVIMNGQTNNMKALNSTTYVSRGGKWWPKFHTETAVMEQPQQ